MAMRLVRKWFKQASVHGFALQPQSKQSVAQASPASATRVVINQTPDSLLPDEQLSLLTTYFIVCSYKVGNKWDVLLMTPYLFLVLHEHNWLLPGSAPPLNSKNELLHDKFRRFTLYEGCGKLNAEAVP